MGSIADIARAGHFGSERPRLCENAFNDSPATRQKESTTSFVVGDDRSQSTLFPERLDDYLGDNNSSDAGFQDDS
jgi:hypothetical protein